MSKVKGKHRQHSKVNRRSKENSRKDGIHADEETGLEEHLENLSTNDIGKNICCLFYFLLYLVCTFDIGLLNVSCLNITFRIPLRLYNGQHYEIQINPCGANVLHTTFLFLSITIESSHYLIMEILQLYKVKITFFYLYYIQ